MAELKDIPGIGKAAMDLLDAAGIRDSAHLARQDPEELLDELVQANEVLSVVKRTPGLSTVEKWVAASIDLEVEDAEAEESETEKPAPKQKSKPSEPVAPPVNYEQNPEVAAMLEQAPCAIPLPGKIMMAGKLRVADVPAGKLLNRYSGDLDVRVGNSDSDRNEVPSRRASNVTSTNGAMAGEPDIDSAAVKPMQPEKKARRTVSSQSKNPEQDRVALIRSPLEKTNRGKDPDSRRFIRGVLHTHPISMRVAAISTLLLLIILPLAVIATFLLLISREFPGTLPWVRHWIIAFPIALPIAALFYFIWGFHAKCRICTQKPFVHKAARKHIKAHHAPGLGFVFPLCVHLLTFSWFRCSSCGTPVRLKK